MSPRDHSRSYILAAIERPCTTLYMALIATFASSVFNPFGDIAGFVRPGRIFPYPLVFWLKFGDVLFGTDAWCWGLKREEARLISGEIIFQEFQPIWSQYLDVTDSIDWRTDGRTTCRGNTSLFTARCYAERVIAIATGKLYVCLSVCNV